MSFTLLHRLFLVLLVVLAWSLLAVPAFEFSSPEDCRDVCDGYFAFQSESEARSCCQITRNYSFGGPTQPQLDGKDVHSSGSSSSSAGSAGLTVPCSNLGGPDQTSVRVRYPSSSDGTSSSSSSPVTQCPLCVGATAQGNQCTGGRKIPTEAPQEKDDSISKVEASTTSESVVTMQFSKSLIIVVGSLFWMTI